jgi:hypothetical protein
MYAIEKKGYGFKLTFAGSIAADEMKQWVKESGEELARYRPSFGVFVDMRTLEPLLPVARDVMKKGQRLYKEKGMERSAVIVSNAVTKTQFQRIAKETGIYEWERYIDASSDADFEQTGIMWLTDAVDPDKA